MENPFPKRRKTSPMTGKAEIYGGQPFQKPPEKQSGWPTYRSPTKASLARSYPHLVPTASAVPDSRCLFREESYQFPNKRALDRSTRISINIDGKPPEGLSQDPRASPPEAATAASSQPSPTVDSDTNVHSDASPTKPDTPQNGTIPKTPGKKRRRFPEYTEDGEPRLPSTPTQLGLEPPPKPPSGLLSSGSPRKKPRSLVRPSSLSSPLKPRKAVSASTSPSRDPQTPRSTSRKTGDDIRIVDIPSPDPALEVQLRLVYDDSIGKVIEETTISKLSDWAAAELGPLLNELATGQDLHFLREAVARYWALSAERARCWARCESAAREIMSSDRHALPRGPESSPPAEDPAPQNFLGRQHLVVHRGGVTLAVQWQIVPCPEEDTILQRRLSAHTTFGEQDDGPGGVKVDGAGEAFEALMARGMEVQEAVEVLVKTLFCK
ncbi:MAG: hypothetical protein Q9173_007258 [Seirophora scorigena]